MCAINSALDVGRIKKREKYVPFVNDGGQPKRVKTFVEDWVRHPRAPTSIAATERQNVIN